MLILDAQYDQFMKRLRKIRLDRLKKIFLLVDFAFVLVASIKAISIVDNKLPVLFSFANEYLNYYTLTLALSFYFLTLVYIVGLYRKFIDISLVKSFFSIAKAVFWGVLLLFITTFGFIDLFDHPNAWSTFLKLYILFSFSIACSRILLSYIITKIKELGFWQHNSTLIGNANVLDKAFYELEHLGKKWGHHIDRVVSTDVKPVGVPNVMVMPTVVAFKQFVDEHNPDEIIIVLPAFQASETYEMLTFLKSKNITVRLYPDMASILEGFVKINNLTDPPYITIDNKVLPMWQLIIKRCLDVFLSFMGLLVVLPLFPFIIWGVRKSSPGSIFYFQERIGKNGKPFDIIKFRTMFMDAEDKGPTLSSSDDPRITPFGGFLRRWRLDELPQFINVLKGDMAIVGPRPERRFFIDQILVKAPHYSRILNVKPGITSMGMVKYGYAENVDQMINRLKYDIIYMEDLSLELDFKIILYTLRTLLMGEGK